jgi:predicted RNA-binding protein associated with RNAse of E/G family
VYLEDESELKAALVEGIVSEEEFSMAYDVANKLVEQIKNSQNIFVNRMAQDVEILNK